nr:U32 family peptidase [Anaerosporobacter faecicola]
MKIVSGLGSVDEYIPYVKAGADEFFCGYVPYEWLRKYGVFLPLNRREVVCCQVQIGSRSELKILGHMMEKYGKPIQITLNSLYYIPEQYAIIAEMIQDCMEIGFDTFIIADLALLNYIRRQGIQCKVHISGEMAEVNRPMMEMLDSFDIERYIFHRKNTIEDMRSCIDERKNKSTEYEAFILNEWCHFTGAYCNSLHCDELPHLCKVPYELKRIEKQTKNQIGKRMEEPMWKESQEETFHYQTGKTGCGLCALKQLQKAGITHLKLVGRGNYPSFMQEDIKQLKRAMELSEDIENENEFRQEIRYKIMNGSCSQVCYYREEIENAD